MDGTHLGKPPQHCLGLDPQLLSSASALATEGFMRNPPTVYGSEASFYAGYVVRAEENQAGC